MTKLSPAALTVWSAFLDHYEWEVTQTELCAVAAALRAAADQVVPEHVNPVGDLHDEARQDQWIRIRFKILAIATELEAQ